MSLRGTAVVLQRAEHWIGDSHTAAVDRAQGRSSHQVETIRINRAAAVGGHSETAEIAGDNGIQKVNGSGTSVEDSAAAFISAKVGVGVIVRNGAVKEIDCAEVDGIIDTPSVSIGTVAAHRAVGKSQWPSVVVDASTTASGAVTAHCAVGKRQCATTMKDATADATGIPAHRAVYKRRRYANKVKDATTATGGVVTARCAVNKCQRTAAVLDPAAGGGVVPAHHAVYKRHCATLVKDATAAATVVPTHRAIDKSQRASVVDAATAEAGGVAVTHRAIGKSQRATVVDTATASAVFLHCEW